MRQLISEQKYNFMYVYIYINKRWTAANRDVYLNEVFIADKNTNFRTFQKFFIRCIYG